MIGEAVRRVEARRESWRETEVVSRARVRLRNACDLILRAAVCDWLRNRSAVAPALVAMSVLLLLTGLFLLCGVAVRGVLESESRQAAILHVYLRGEADPAQVAALRARLAQDARVRSIRYVSRAAALREAERRPALSDLAAGNPLPASLSVEVRDPSQVGAVNREMVSAPTVDPAYPTSDDAEVYAALRSFALVGGLAVSALLLAMALVSVATTASALREAIRVRQDDVMVMRMAGAAGWVLRLPFLIEGALTGAAAAVVASTLMLALYAGLRLAGSQAFVEVLPGVGWGAVLGTGGALLGAGLILGCLALLPNLHRLRRCGS